MVFGILFKKKKSEFREYLKHFFPKRRGETNQIARYLLGIKW